MRVLIVRYQNRSDFVERYESSFRYGGIFFPTRKAIEPGVPVLLDIRLPELRDHMLIRGTVAWRQRGKRTKAQRAGLGIEFLATEQPKRDHLLALTKGDLDPDAAQRRHRRLPIELQVDWRVPNERTRHISLVDDIGIGGAFLRTRELPAMGTPLVIELCPPGASVAHMIEGRVAWQRTTPGLEGVGVEFRCRDIGGTRRLRELVKRIEAVELSAASA